MSFVCFGRLLSAVHFSNTYIFSLDLNVNTQVHWNMREMVRDFTVMNSLQISAGKVA